VEFLPKENILLTTRELSENQIVNFSGVAFLVRRKLGKQGNLFKYEVMEIDLEGPELGQNQETRKVSP